MTFFHEMYGRYFRIVSVLLRRESCTEAEIRALIVAEGFGESVLFLPQKLIPQADGSDWGLLRRTANGRLEPVTRHLPMMPVTAVQKRWLRAKLNDPRLRLFLDDTAFAALSETLRDVPPLYLPEWFSLSRPLFRRRSVYAKRIPRAFPYRFAGSTCPKTACRSVSLRKGCRNLHALYAAVSGILR